MSSEEQITAEAVPNALEVSVIAREMIVEKLNQSRSGEEPLNHQVQIVLNTALEALDAHTKARKFLQNELSDYKSGKKRVYQHHYGPQKRRTNEEVDEVLLDVLKEAYEEGVRVAVKKQLPKIVGLVATIVTLSAGVVIYNRRK